MRACSAFVSALEIRPLSSVLLNGLSFAPAGTETMAVSIPTATAKTVVLSVLVFIKWFNMFLPSFRICICGATGHDVVSSQSLLRVSSQKGQARLHRYRLPFTEMLSDMELTIVHEFLHFELASLLRSEASAEAKNTRLTAAIRRSIARNDRSFSNRTAVHAVGTQFNAGVRHSQSRQPRCTRTAGKRVHDVPCTVLNEFQE